MHRPSLLSPAGLADGLALKESRYGRLGCASTGTSGSARFAPWPDGQLVPPRPTAERGFGLDRRGHASSTAHAPDGKTAASSGAFRDRLLAGDLGDVARHEVGVSTREEPGRHAAVAGAADLDRVQDAVAIDSAELVEVRP